MTIANFDSCVILSLSKDQFSLGQSRLAKMENGDDSVSLDLIFRSLFALGVSRKRRAASL
jgi:hypothetical protein